VSGGDGTVAQAVAAAAGTPLEVAVLPGGTLNHFARDLGLPVDDLAAALEVAATGTPRTIDLGYVNDRAVLNTSSLGAYVNFVRMRERLERWLGYWLASVVAALRVWLAIRGFVVTFRTDDGAERRYHTPLLFVGVGERALARDDAEDGGVGARARDGRRALHVLVVRESRPARVAALAFGALARGVDAIARTDALDAFLVEECTVTLRRAWGRVSVDGELVRMKSPLRYSLVRDAARVVGPS
jgi:diacylglycerol kinase family enzyme